MAFDSELYTDAQYQRFLHFLEDYSQSKDGSYENNHELRMVLRPKEEELVAGNNDEKKATLSETADGLPENVDAVVIVAIPEEKKGAFDAFEIPRDQRGKGTWTSGYNFRYYMISLKDGQKSYSVVLLLQIEMGMTVTASLATRAILAFHPKLVAMVGICGGRNGKVGLGDIIVASSVFDNSAGKHYKTKFKFRPNPIPLDYAFKDVVSNIAIGNEELLGRIKQDYGGELPSDQIKILLAPIATGSAIVDNSGVVDEIAEVMDHLAGMDMEAYGLATAANAFGIRWIVAKSVQDFANGKKSEDEAKIRSFAAYASAKFLRCILPDLLEVTQ